MACLDTSTLIDMMPRGRARSPAYYRAHKLIDGLRASNSRLTTTRLNVAELYAGLYRSDRFAAEEAMVKAVLESLDILEFGIESARMFGLLSARLHEIGRYPGDMDVLIAATAIQHDEPLITRNAKHFTDIPGLRVMTY